MLEGVVVVAEEVEHRPHHRNSQARAVAARNTCSRTRAGDGRRRLVQGAVASVVAPRVTVVLVIATPPMTVDRKMVMNTSEMTGMMVARAEPKPISSRRRWP